MVLTPLECQGTHTMFWASSSACRFQNTKPMLLPDILMPSFQFSLSFFCLLTIAPDVFSAISFSAITLLLLTFIIQWIFPLASKIFFYLYPRFFSWLLIGLIISAAIHYLIIKLYLKVLIFREYYVILNLSKFSVTFFIVA